MHPPPDMPSRHALTWAELTKQAEHALQASGLSSVDARRIVEEVTGAQGAEFHRVLDTFATVQAMARFDALLARRLNGEPLQYVLGRWGFRSLDLLIDTRVLIPRPETEIVAGLAIDEARARSGTEVLVADLGTGSGAIALSMAVECESCRVLATDRSKDALAVARANLCGLGRAATRVGLYHGDWFAALPANTRGAIDVIVSNPPYIRDDEPLPETVAHWEPTVALRAGPHGDEALSQIVKGAIAWLTPTGSLVLEMAPHQTQPIAELATYLGYQSTVHADMTGRPRAVTAQKLRPCI